MWREVFDEAGTLEGGQGLCTALAMQALAFEDAGQHAAADEALAECQSLESPRWPARLRRRCSWLALSRMALVRDEPALRERAEAASQQLVTQLGVLGAWREQSIVRVHQAQMMRLAGRHRAAAALLFELSRVRLALGCRVDAGISQGLACAALVQAGHEDIDAGSVEDWTQACEAALQALSNLAPLPALLRHFVEPLALLACRLDDPAQAALLLAGADRLRADHHYGRDPQSARAAQQARTEAVQRLTPYLLALAQAHGGALDAEALRVQALTWLQRRRPAPPGSGGGGAVASRN
jgi:hypothetical protein